MIRVPGVGGGDDGPLKERPDRSVSAELVFPAPQPVVFAFVADLDNHGGFATDAIRLVSLEGHQGARQGGRLELQTPWGRRDAHLQVVRVTPPHLLDGRARVGAKTEIELTWSFTPHPQGTLVTLTLVAAELSMKDAVAWRTGGQSWLTKQLQATLAAVEAAGRPR